MHLRGDHPTMFARIVGETTGNDPAFISCESIGSLRALLFSFQGQFRKLKTMRRDFQTIIDEFHAGVSERYRILRVKHVAEFARLSSQRRT